MALEKEEIQEIERVINASLDKKLEPIFDKLSDISRDLSEIRRDLGYNNLTVLKGKQDISEDRDEM